MLRCLYLLFSTLIGWILLLPVMTQAQPLALSPTEQAWLDSHRQQELRLGIAPGSGMELFSLHQLQAGYIPELVKLFNAETGLRIRIEQDKNWSRLYNRFLSGELDLLLGANVTPQRRQFMAFTRPIVSYPYRLFTRKSGQILTLGDLHDHRLGFISDDVVFSLFPARYPNIQYRSHSFSDMPSALAALATGKIDGLIAQAGSESRSFLQQYPNLQATATLQDITSDMTLASRLADEPLASMLDKILAAHRMSIDRIVERNRLLYNRKVLRLNDAERRWLEQDPLIRVGMADDYLPFDAARDGKPSGITGAFLNELHQLTGLRIQVVTGPFNQLHQMMQQGSLDMLNIANTSENRRHFLFTQPFFSERDIIIGRRASPYVQDVYGLEGKRVAVIEGFWHENYLKRNLHQVRITTTRNLQESLERLSNHEVDYLIENPTVLEYYISGLGFRDLERKGNTAADSFMYFGVNPALPELVSLFNKTLPLIDSEQMRTQGLNSVPDLRQQRMQLLIILASVLAAALLISLLFGCRLLRRFLSQRTANQLLHERQQLMQLDPLTGVYNRLGFNQLQTELALSTTPQAWWVIDLNNLKLVNDHFGHLSGDALLIQFAHFLRQQFPSALLFRMGGDEFIVVQQNIDYPAAVSRHQTLLRALLETRLPQQQQSPHLTPGALAAAGMVWRHDASLSLQEIIRQADQQMYEHKRHSKLNTPAVDYPVAESTR